MKRYILVAALALGLLAPLCTVAKAAALSGGDFRAGNIIDDGVFNNSSAMNPTQIQNFLNAKVPNCDTNGSQIYSGNQTRAQYGASKGNPAPYTCLRDYVQATPTKNAEPGLCNAYSGGTKTAAQIIYDVGQACGTNPQVLLILLQKEQSLITDDWPWPIQYRSATGYGCPDTAPCDSDYYGFFNQVYNAARGYKKYARDASLYNYQAGRNNNILDNPDRGCGSSSIYLQNQATAGLYNYTPYQPNAAALNNLYGSGDGCSAYGNRNFWRMFNDWFGNTNLPTAFKGPSSGAVYVLANGYKFAVPDMATLQDYGIPPGAIATIPQGAVEGTPTAPASSGYSGSLGYVVKSASDSDADGGTVYLISVGKRYSITSMAQFNGYGFDKLPLTYLPLGLINSISDGGNLGNFIATPSSNVFEIMAATKRIIFNPDTFKRRNAGTPVSLVSMNTASIIPSGAPISDTPVLISNAAGTIYTYADSKYYTVPSMNVMDCWNFTALGLPLYQPMSDSFIAAPATSGLLDCNVADANSARFILDQGSKVPVPTSLGITSGQSLDSTMSSLLQRVPSRSGSLGQVVKSKTDSGIWYIENGVRKAIPTMRDFDLLGLSLDRLDSISSSSVQSIPATGIKLGVGMAVKSDSSPAVSVIMPGNTKRSFASGDDYLALGFKWSDLATFPASVLESAYPTTNGTPISPYLLDRVANTAYLLDPSGCYTLTDSQLAQYGQSRSALNTAQTYERADLPSLNLSSCRPAPTYIKQAGSGTVYRVESGSKRPFSSWAKLTSAAGSDTPDIVTLSPSTVASLPLGPTI